MAGIGEALQGGIDKLTDLLNQALGTPPAPQPDAQPADQPGANETATPPPPDLEDWAYPAPPDAATPPPVSPPDLAPPSAPDLSTPSDDQAGPGVPNAPGEPPLSDAVQNALDSLNAQSWGSQNTGAVEQGPSNPPGVVQSQPLLDVPSAGTAYPAGNVQSSPLSDISPWNTPYNYGSMYNPSLGEQVAGDLSQLSNYPSPTAYGQPAFGEPSLPPAYNYGSMYNPDLTSVPGTYSPTEAIDAINKAAGIDPNTGRQFEVPGSGIPYQASNNPVSMEFPGGFSKSPPDAPGLGMYPQERINEGFQQPFNPPPNQRLDDAFRQLTTNPQVDPDLQGMTPSPYLPTPGMEPLPGNPYTPPPSSYSGVDERVSISPSEILGIPPQLPRMPSDVVTPPVPTAAERAAAIEQLRQGLGGQPQPQSQSYPPFQYQGPFQSAYGSPAIGTSPGMAPNMGGFDNFGPGALPNVPPQPQMQDVAPGDVRLPPMIYPPNLQTQPPLTNPRYLDPTPLGPDTGGFQRSPDQLARDAATAAEAARQRAIREDTTVNPADVVAPPAPLATPAPPPPPPPAPRPAPAPRYVAPAPRYVAPRPAVRVPVPQGTLGSNVRSFSPGSNLQAIQEPGMRAFYESLGVRFR